MAPTMWRAMQNIKISLHSPLNQEVKHVYSTFYQETSKCALCHLKYAFSCKRTSLQSKAQPYLLLSTSPLKHELLMLNNGVSNIKDDKEDNANCWPKKVWGTMNTNVAPFLLKYCNFNYRLLTIRSFQQMTC